MKLRINAKLRAALIAAITAVGFTLSQATASTVLDGKTYSGDVYTWSKGGTSQADLAYGGWKKTTQGDSGYIYEAEITTWNPTIRGLIANGGSTTFTNDLNTIRFATDTGSNTNMTYTFFPLSVGGIIAENAGYTITAGSGNRPVYIGNATATAARSDIKGNFTINTSGAGDNGTMTFMGTQTWNVASGATFTLNSGKHAKTVSGALSITGGGTVAFDGTGTVAMTGDSSLEIQANTTLQVSSGLTMAASGATVTNNGNLQLGGTIKFGAAGIENNGTVSLTSTGLVFDLSQLTDQDNTYTLFTGSSAVDLSTLGLSSANITGIVTAGKTFTFHDNGTITFEAATKKTWTAQSAANWNYEDENWEDGKFVSGDGALFNLDESMAIVNAAVEASSIEVASGSTVTLNVSDAGSLSSASVVLDNGATMISNLSINNVEEFSVGSGATWNIFANQSLGKGTNNGTIYLGAEGTARLTDASNSKDLLLGITGSGNIEVAVNTNIEGGTNAASKVSSQATGKLIIDQGVALTLGRPEISGAFQQRYIDLSSFSAVDLNGGTLKVHMNNLQLNNLTTNTANSTIHVMDTAGSNQPALTLKGTTTLNKDLTLTSNWKHQIVIEKLAGSGTLTLNGANDSVVNIGTPGGDTGTVGKISVDSDVTKATLNGKLDITGNLTLKNGTTKVTGTTNVGGELDLSSGGQSKATLTITEGATVNVASTFWGHSGSHLNIEKGGALNLNSVKLGLVGLEGGGSITSPSNKDYSVGNANFTLSGVAITAKDSMTIGNKLTDSSISTGANAVTLSNTGNTLTGGTVAEGGSLSIAGGGLVGTAIANNGTLTFTGDITATGFEVNSGSTGLVDVEGKTDSGNGFETTSGNYIVIATNGDGATLNANSHKVTQNEVDYAIQANGTAVAAGGSVEYSTYFQTNGEVSVSEIQAAADKEHEVCMTAVVSDTGILNVDEGLGFISASGGEVNFIGEAAADMFFVTGDTKVSGLKDISIMSIEAGKTATMTDGISAGDVTFSSEEGGVQVTNTNPEGGSSIQYGIDQAAAQVTADTMTVGGTEEVVVSNSLVVDAIVNNNANGLVLNGNVEDGVTLRAIGGDIVLAGQTSNTVSVVDLEIAADKIVMMPNGDDEGTITVTDTLTGGDATLLANLTLLGGSTLNVSGGNDKALTLGSELTIDLSNKSLVNLDDDTLIALNNMGAGETLKLIVSADPELDALMYGGDGYDGLGYDELFSRIGGQGVELQGNYTVYAKGDAFGLMKSTSPIPEPTTGTLSLLALMALAARRRRK